MTDETPTTDTEAGAKFGDRRTIARALEGVPTTFKEIKAARQETRQAAFDSGEKPIAKFAPAAGRRSIKLYADGGIESPFGNGSVVGAVARVDQSDIRRTFRDTHQTHLTIEGPLVAIAHKLTHHGGMTVNLARKFAATVNRLAAVHQAAPAAKSSIDDSIPRPDS
jgi:phage baseplate assembly protein gpV